MAAAALMVRRGSDAATRVALVVLAALACAAHAADPAGAGGGAPPFDITKLGAKADGKTDSTKAVQAAWASACSAAGKQTVLIPEGDYLTGPLLFRGPCMGAVTVQLDGNLLSSTDLALFKGNWIEVEQVNGLVITGKGTLDGQGADVWPENACTKLYDCKALPNSLVLHSVNNAEVSGITLLNSKFFQMNIVHCNGVAVKDVVITAPGNSPDTDGIHVSSSTGVTIADTNIGSGDDCVSIGGSTSGVNITRVTCDPGQGINVGGLGKHIDEKDVSNVNVNDCLVRNADVGLRIKAYEDAKAPITASKIHYENVVMENVKYPIVIDTKYCPPKKMVCPPTLTPKVVVKDVSFKNITGTSSGAEVVKFRCFEKLPCTGITMNDVKVEYKGTNNKTMAVCQNAQGTATGCLSELAACF